MIKKEDLIGYNSKIIKYRINNNSYISSIYISTDESVTLGHPMYQKTRRISCGRRHLPMDNLLTELDDVKLPREKDINDWIYEYNKYHESVIKDIGYDSCSEDLNLLILNTNIEHWIL